MQTTHEESNPITKPPTMPVEASVVTADRLGTLEVAAERLDTARAAHKSALDSISSSEKRMSEIQSEAEKMQLASLEASLEVKEAKEAQQRYIDNEERKFAAYKTALDILDEAKQMVEKMKNELLESQKARIDHEIENAPVFIKEAQTKIALNKHLKLAHLESAECKLIVATAERQLVQSEISVADLQLDLLATTEALGAWPQIRESITFNGGSF